MRRALVVDPGKVTGYGFLEWEPGSGEASFRGGELGHDDFVDNMAAWLYRGCAIDLVVWERFTVNQRTIKEAGGQRMWSLEQTGVMETFCRWAGVPVHYQTPSDAMAWGTNEKLKAVGWYAGNRGEKGHRRDAARHALLYCNRQQIIDPRRFLP